MLLRASLAFSLAISAHAVPNAAASDPAPVEQSARGTEANPLIMSPGAAEIAAEHRERDVHTRNERWLTGATGALALFTLLLWWTTRTMVRQTAFDMNRSVGEAARSADAMQKLATAFAANTERMQAIMQKQMRAYVAVDPGMPLYQDGRHKFGSRPKLLNTGFTPARNVRYRIQSAILPFPPPANHIFPDTAPLSDHDASLSPRQEYIAYAGVDTNFSDADVAAIMQGQTKRLFTWGTVIYDDVFDGRQWETKFCHHFDWFHPKDPKGQKDMEEWRFETFYHVTHNSGM